MSTSDQVGRYIPVEKIGSGGMAEVFRGFYEVSGGVKKTVAIKRLLPTQSGEKYKKMLMDEARVLIHLHHQTIVQIIDVGEAQGLPFIVMEYIDGVDLGKLFRQLVSQNKTLPSKYAIYIVLQILVALEFAHSCKDEEDRPLNLVHRDVSPSNVLLSRNGEVKVADFGIAKGLHRLGHSIADGLKGKIAYMSPEQVDRGVVDSRADIFACGVILYELLMRAKLFDGESEIEVLEKVRNVELPYDELKRINPILRTVLYRALARDRKNRYQSASEMREDLEKYSAHSAGLGSEFGKYLRQLFRGELNNKSRNISCGDQVCKTRCCHKKNGRQSPVLGLSSLAFAMVLVAFIPADIAIRKMNVGELSLVGTEGDTFLYSAAQIVPPKGGGGTVVIDTSPTNADCTLRVNGVVKRYKTPFVLKDMDLKKRGRGMIEISMPGFESLQDTFEVDSRHPVFVRNYTLKQELSAGLKISASPWGIVDITGVVSAREAPVAMHKLKAGEYLVRVANSGLGQAVTTRIKVSDGEKKHCTAEFKKNVTASFRCKVSHFDASP